MDIKYRVGILPPVEQIVELYDKAGLPRPTADQDRIRKMYENSNLVLTAWDGDQLVGVSRCITDWVWSCYLADLAVDPAYQKSGIGKKLIEMTQEQVGELSMILLLSVPGAMTYYPKVGFAKEDRAFMIGRKR